MINKLKKEQLIQILKAYIDLYGEDCLNKVLMIQSNATSTIDNKCLITPSLQLANYAMTNTLISEKELLQFQKLFFNRTDVYAKYWANQTKSGYSFSCSNEWKRGLCQKLAKKSCVNCLAKKFLALTMFEIKQHLYHDKHIGTYAIDQQNCSKFLVFDFDEEDWMNNVVGLQKVVHDFGLHCYIEISKSANGAHLWIFFNQPVEARILRRFGEICLFTLMDTHPHLNLNAFDRMFPAQDTITQDGLGNLIALPYSSLFLKQPGSYYLDKNYCPISLPTFLKEVQLNNPLKITVVNKQHAINFLEQISSITKSNHLINITISGELLFNLKELTPSILKFLKFLSSFKNPEYTKKTRMRFSTYNIPYMIACYSYDSQYLRIPRGLYTQVINKFKETNILYKTHNSFNSFNQINIKDNINFYPEQTLAFNQLISNKIGILHAPTGFGKTVLGIKLICHYQCTTLILVHTDVIAKQWYNKLLKHTNLTEEDIAYKSLNFKGVNILTVQSLINKTNVTDLTKNINLVLVDECHHYASQAYEQVLKSINAEYVYGLTATPKRSDSLDKILSFRMGDIVKGISNKSTIAKEIIIHNTDFNVISTDKLTLDDFHQKLILDKARNEQIVNDILISTKRSKAVLVIFERKQHLEIIQNWLNSQLDNLIILHGDMNTKQLKWEYEKLKLESSKVILATGALIGEGFDSQDIDTIIMTFPFKWKGKAQQYIGRMRIDDYKHTLRIIDYFDVNVSYYVKMFHARLKAYKELGFEIIEADATNQIVYNLQQAKKQIQLDIKQSELIWSSYKFSFLATCENVYYIDHEIKFVIINKKIVWILDNKQTIMRIQSNLLANELLNNYKI